MALFLIVLALIIPLFIVFLWRKKPIIAFLSAVFLYFALITAPGIIQTFQAMMDAGTGDPNLIAGNIAATVTISLFGLVLGVPVLAFTQWLGRRREQLKRMEANARQTFE